jgi:3-oxoacyl-[acyl-carrier protein] reductase
MEGKKMRLKEKVAVITGAGSGIGRGTAIMFAKHGAKVVVADIHLEAAQETCKMIEENGGDAIPVQVDVSIALDVRNMYKATLEHFGKLDILYNNAGVPMSANNIEDVSEEMFDRIFDVNVKGVFLGCKYAVPIFKEQKTGGVIINTASISAYRPRGGQNAYAASKSAVITLTKSLALELASDQVRVVGINPVAADTPMLAGFIGDRDEEEARKTYIASIPLGRMAQPEDIAYAALYLASNEASLVTGTILDVDGGRGI